MAWQLGTSRANGHTVSMRRVTLTTGLVLLVLSAGHRAGAGVTGEVEVDGYGGRTSGGWTCGPAGTAKYGGLAMKASIAQRGVDTPTGQGEGQGTVGSLTSAFEVESISIADSPGYSVKPPGPWTTIVGGAQVNAGYRWPWFGLEGGLGFFLYPMSPREPHSEASTSSEWTVSRDHDVLPFPNLELSFGPRSKAYGVIGVGSPLATSVVRPGLAYAGVSCVLDNKMAFDIRGGIYFRGPGAGEGGPRFDLAGRGPITDTISLRLGANVGMPDEWTPLDFEGSMGLIFAY
jgi:hypothetical protein